MDESQSNTRVECCRIDGNSFKQSYVTSNFIKLSLLNVNIHSIRKKFNSLRLFLNNSIYEFSFIVLSDTWLDITIVVGFELSGYRSLQLYRNKNVGGQRLCYIDALNVSILSNSPLFFRRLTNAY